MDFNPNPQRPIAIQDESRLSQDNRMPHPPQITRESEARNSPDHGQPHDQSMGGMGPHEGMKPMKRACNDCRQQKLRCDVVQSPFAPCSRCRKLGKNCTVDTLFKRVGRRDKFSEMQREIEELRWKLRRATHGALPMPRQDPSIRSAAEDEVGAVRASSNRELGHFTVSGELLDDLFKQFFTLYHPLLPFLDPQQSPDYYFRLSPILGWSIVMIGARRFEREPSLRSTLTPDYVRLMWSSISDVPQTYHIVKALCLICFWPIPTDALSKDPTSQLAALMMQIALQNMLHLDHRAQVPFRGELSELEQKDRLMTWAACNIVAQSTSTYLGLPPNTIYEGVLGSDFTFLSPHQIPDELIGQLKVAQFCNTFTKAFYCNPTQPNGLIAEPERAGALETLKSMYTRLQIALQDHMSVVTKLHLDATNVHLNAFAFFLPHGTQTHNDGLLDLYNAICIFLQGVMDNETSTGTLLEHCSSYIAQTIFSSTFALVKLLNSSFAGNVDTERGKALFNGIILAARKMSVEKDDIASRVGTRVPLLWRSVAPWSPSQPDPLVFRVQFRMSVSHIYDCHWAFREQLKSKVPGQTIALDGSVTPGDDVTSQTENNGLISGYAGLPFAGLDLDTIEMVNSSDWVFGDWTGLPQTPYGYQSIMTA